MNPSHIATPLPPAAPPWPVFLLLPLLHYASIRLTNLLAITPESVVVVWLPNAVLLAALLHYQGQGAFRLAALAFTSDLMANLPAFPLVESVLLCMVNLAEVAGTYLLLRRMRTSPRLDRIQDFGNFVVAGPVLGALVAGLLAAAVLKRLPDTTTPYFTLVRIWWFGDGLGLLIVTPLLLAFAQPNQHPRRLHRLDNLVLLLGVGLAVLVFTSPSGEMGGVPATPTLLLPWVLYLAVRFGLRWTALAVALLSLATAWVLTIGHHPFGPVGIHQEIVRAQEFILTLCTIGLGFAILLAQLQAHERELEAKVLARTQELEDINTQLSALSTTDSLTGIANRRHFDEVLASEWSRAARSPHALALVMLDVDFFKPYNDHYGHLAGDDCLRQIANALAAHMRRPGDLVARYGGEEFVLLAPVSNATDAWRMAESVRQALAELALPHAASPLGMVTASLGLALHVPTLGETADLLLQQADQALYQAKALGRNQTVLLSQPTAAT